RLLFGRTAAAQLPDVARDLGARRMFVVTDAILDKAGVVEAVAGVLRTAKVALDFFHVDRPEPAVETVRAAAAAARAFNPDAVLGLGGGSNMDTAKLVGLVLAHGGDATDYTGDCRVPGPVTPLVCVPTTAGTGSEVSAAAVFTDTEKQIKVSCLSPYLRPDVAVVDPLLTVSCPPKVTADSGIDALTHAIEAFTAVDNDAFPLPAGERSVYQGKNPLADATAREAITLVGRFLRRAVQDGRDAEARDGMALAATLGGLAFSNAGVALVHAMEYPVGGAVHVSHGAGNGLLLPFVMEFNRPRRVAAFAEVARLLGVDTRAMTEADAAVAAVEAVSLLRHEIGVPTRLRDIGVREEMLPGFAAKAFGIKRLMRVNPRMPQNEGEVLDVYRAAF
ncbi:MAG: iron-containing alcohol dehydrogenase, partial [Gemmataceae bacterium]|nr:iron-containing alcohol dehydrogenase [Gemmataceae bacterium]